MTQEEQDEVMENEGLVYWTAKKYMGMKHGYYQSIGFMDLIQEGYRGLAYAVQNFSPDKGDKLSTYATVCIRGYMLRHIGQFKSVLKVPHNAYFEFKKIKKKKSGLGFGDLTGLTAEEQTKYRLFERATKVIPIDMPSRGKGGFRGNWYTGLEQRSAFEIEDPVDRYAQQQAQFELAEILEVECLTDREKFILREYYGFDSNGVITSGNSTLEEVGKKLWITRERVRQILQVAIKKIKVERKRNPTVRTNAKL